MADHRWKGLGTRIGQIRHFVFFAGHIAIDPPTSARLYSVDYLHWRDFAELKKITVSINRFVSSILCENKMFPEMTPWPNASIFQSERGGSNSVSMITITGHCFPLNQNNIFFSIGIRSRSYTFYLAGAWWLSCILTCGMLHVNWHPNKHSYY